MVMMRSRWSLGFLAATDGRYARGSSRYVSNDLRQVERIPLPFRSPVCSLALNITTVKKEANASRPVDSIATEPRKQITSNDRLWLHRGETQMAAPQSHSTRSTWHRRQQRVIESWTA